MGTSRLASLGDLAAGATSRAEQLAEVLEERVVSLGLSPGDLVGTLEEIRAGSGLSRPTVSEAVRLLRDRGVLLIKPGRGGGLFVADQGPVVRLRRTLLKVTEDPGTVADAVELRDRLELLIDLGAARHRSSSDVVDLRRLLMVLERASDWPAFMAANWALHERIAAICPNAMARAVYTGTLGHLSSASATCDHDLDGSAYRAERQAAHVDLVDSIAGGDEARVRAAVARHSGSAPSASEEDPT